MSGEFGRIDWLRASPPWIKDHDERVEETRKMILANEFLTISHFVKIAESYQWKRYLSEMSVQEEYIQNGRIVLVKHNNVLLIRESRVWRLDQSTKEILWAIPLLTITETNKEQLLK